jgi:predicted CopG family antitoxin
MATCTISVTTKAYETLKKMRREGESFSDVIEQNLKPKPATAGELLDELVRDFEGVKIIDPKAMAAVKAGRGRRSKRPAPKAHVS